MQLFKFYCFSQVCISFRNPLVESDSNKCSSATIMENVQSFEDEIDDLEVCECMCSNDDKFYHW